MTVIFAEGMEAIFANMDGHFAEQGTRINQALQGAGIECQAETKKNCPVGTPESTHKKGYIGGRLRASYQYEALPFEVRVWTNVDYAPPVEFGTYKMAARPHFNPAFQLAGQHLQEELSTIL